MSFATKADLQTAIGDWMARTDLSSFYDDFVTLAESYLNNSVLMRLFETNTTLTGVVSSNSLTLPSDFSDPIGLTILDTTYGGNTYQELVPMTYDQMTIHTTNGRPTAWAINGLLISLNWPCDQTYTFNLRYDQLFELTTAGSTNYLLQNYPDVYLAACMVQANIFTKDIAAVQVWQGKLENAIAGVIRVESKSKARSILTGDPAILRSGNRYPYYYGGWYW